VVAAGVATAALPDASVTRAGTSATSTTPSIDRLVAGASAPAPGACSSAASTALGVGGAGSHLSGGPAACRFLPLLPFPTTSTPRSPREPCCSRSRYSSSRCSRRYRRWILCSFLHVARSCSRHRAERAWARGVGGSDRAAFTATLC
jgi:hypothetical protein